MILICVLLTIYLMYCESKITINIKADSYKPKSNVNWTGADEKLASQHDIENFGLTKANLNKGSRIYMEHNASIDQFADKAAFKMKASLPLLCLLVAVYAEAPISDTYLPARGEDHHGSSFRSSFPSSQYGALTSRNSDLSQNYGPPMSRNFSPSQSYGAPSFRNSEPSQTYGAPAFRNSDPSQTYGVPSARNFSPSRSYGAPDVRHSDLSQNYGAASTRNSDSQNYGAPTEIYGAPSARNGPSATYGPSSFRSGLSKDYAAPGYNGDSQNFKSHPSETYEPAGFRSGDVSETYGAPGDRLSDSYGTPLSRSSLSSQYDAPDAGIKDLSQDYGAPSSSGRSFGNPSQKYGTPSTRRGSNQPSDKYGASNARTSISQSYGTPARTPSSSYGAPSRSYNAAKSGSHGQGYGAHKSSYSSVKSSYGVPAKTSAVSSSYASARSQPNTKYGVPTSRGVSASYGAPGVEAKSADGMPSTGYGAPDQYSSDGQGYSYAKNALDELANSEPANYDFSYKVTDAISGSDFGHAETRQENRAEGSYFVVLPDGTKQVVEYEADERGFKPRISVEPAEGAAERAGYDDNAAEIIAKSDGPY